MTRDSWCKKVWNGRSKGLSTVLGIVFLTLVVFAIATNVFLWTLSQNAQYAQAVKDENQKNIDRLSENLIASGTNYSVSESGGRVTVKVTVRNAGSVAAQIINLWVFDTDPSNQRYTNKSLNLNLNPGEAWPYSLTVTIPEANQNHTFVSWFVTARGNTIPLEIVQDIIIAELAQGIGSVSMEFPTFKYYKVLQGDKLGPPQSGFSIPGSEIIVFSLNLTNLDESRKNINLTAQSLLYLFSATGAKTATFQIAKVVNQTLVNFDFQILEFGKPTKLFFGSKSSKATNVADSLCAVNLLLYGTIGTDQYYGQNIPFVAVYVQR